jgi:hypothetical protein
MRRNMKRVTCVAALCAVCALRSMSAAAPAFVDITWMSISNMYMDKWRLDRKGVRPIANTEVKKALGFK